MSYFIFTDKVEPINQHLNDSKLVKGKDLISYIGLGLGLFMFACPMMSKKIIPTPEHQ